MITRRGSAMPWATPDPSYPFCRYATRPSVTSGHPSPHVGGPPGPPRGLGLGGRRRRASPPEGGPWRCSAGSGGRIRGGPNGEGGGGLRPWGGGGAGGGGMGGGAGGERG